MPSICTHPLRLSSDHAIVLRLGMLQALASLAPVFKPGCNEVCTYVHVKRFYRNYNRYRLRHRRYKEW